MITPFSQTYQRVKGHADQQTQQIFGNTADPAAAADWTPEYVETQASIIGQIIEAAQMVVGNLTTVDLARKLRSRPVAVKSLITQRDTGIAKHEEYQRPYWEVVKAVRDGKDHQQAHQAGVRRLSQLTDTDLQMAKVRQAQISLQAAGRKTYRRVTTSDNPCALCEIAATQIYYTDDLMPIHANCSCDIEEDDTGDDQAAADADFQPPDVNRDIDQKKDITDLNENGAPAQDYRDLISVRQHGEVGPMLTWRGQHFTGPKDLPEPITEMRKQRQLATMSKQLARAQERGARGSVVPFYNQRGRPMTIEEVNQRNTAAREQYRRRAAERADIRDTVTAARQTAEAQRELLTTIATDHVTTVRDIIDQLAGGAITFDAALDRVRAMVADQEITDEQAAQIYAALSRVK